MSAKRVALIGSGGAGKTTLAAALAEELALPIVPEFARELMREWAVENLRALSLDGMRRFQLEILRRKVRLESRLHAFVADRSTVDVAVIWLQRLAGRVRDAETARVLERCRTAAARYTHILVVPCHVVPLIDDGVREPNRWLQFAFELSVRGLLTQWQLPWTVLESRCLQDRVAEARQIVERHRSALATREKRL